MAHFSLSSPNFQDQSPIPKEYACTGTDISPELVWKDFPENTKSFALAIVDPDAPSGHFIHWVVYNIPKETTRLPPKMSKDPLLANGTMQGFNDFGTIGYGGPCPPESQNHHYIFTLYALDSMLSLPPGSSYSGLQNAMKGHIIGEAKLTGTFAK